MKMLALLLLIMSPLAHADLFGGGATDYLGNGITSQASGSQRPWDVGINVSGVLVDPRTRTWTLSSGTDSCSAVESGTWNVGLSTGSNTIGIVNQGLPGPIASPWPVAIASSVPFTVTGVSLAFNQTNGTQKSQTVDGSGNVVGPLMTVSGVNYFPVSQPVDVASSTINVTTQDLVSTTATGFANQSLITGTPTANSAASYSLNSIQTVMVLISGTWTGTLSIEVSEDGTTWEPRSIHVIGTSTFSSNITANVAGSMNAAGKTNVRVRGTAAMTGTAAVKILSSDNPSNVYVANSIKLVDGSATPNVNTLTIKAGSVSAASTDTGAVVSIRPDSTMQMFQDRSGTGNMTVACSTPTSCPANSTVTALTNGSSTVNFTLTNTWVGTVVFEGLDGNATWQSTIGTVPGNGSPTAASGTPINISIPSGGFSQLRARCSVYVSGTITANYNVGAGLSTLQVFNLTPSAFQATVTGSGTAGTPSSGVVSIQGVSGGTVVPSNISQIGGNAVNTSTGASSTGTQRVAVANDSKIQVWDGTTTASVKASSTQAALTDTAVVVTGRPDNVGTPTQTSVSCASTTTTLLAASTATMFLSVRNPTTATQTVWINVTGASAVAAAPSIDLAPGSEADFFAEGGSFLPTAQINCISGGTASTVTVVYK